MRRVVHCFQSVGIAGDTTDAFRRTRICTIQANLLRVLQVRMREFGIQLSVVFPAAVRDSHLKIIGGIYDLETGHVELLS